MNEKHYDGMLVFNTPVMIDDTQDNSETFSIIGFLYSTSEHSPQFTIQQEVFACYLMAFEKMLADGGKAIDEFTWQTWDGKIYDVGSTDIRLKIYQYMKPQLQYKLYEFPQELKYTDEEVDGGFILKSSLLDRYGVSFIETVNNIIHHNRVN